MGIFFGGGGALLHMKSTYMFSSNVTSNLEEKIKEVGLNAAIHLNFWFCCHILFE